MSRHSLRIGKQGVVGQLFWHSLSSVPAPAMSCETSLSNRGFILLTFVTSTLTSEDLPRQLAGQTGWLDE